MATRITCCECGWHSKASSPARAQFAFRRHSCELHRPKAPVNRRSGVVRGCHHKYADHQHGDRLAYVLDRCRCDPCTDATAAYEAHRRRMVAYGRWNHRVDAEASRRRMFALQQMGVSFMQVAKLTGIPKTLLGTLMYGMASRRGGAPTRTISADYEARILALEVDPMQFSGASVIHLDGTVRRLQALVAAGWSMRALAGKIGWRAGNLWPLLHGRRNGVHADTARRVRDVYEADWAGPSPANRHEQASKTRAIGYAKSHGWQPPLAWPDDLIDDPNYDPAAEDELVLVDEEAVYRAAHGHHLELTRDELLAAVDQLVTRGVRRKEIAETLRIKPSTVDYYRGVLASRVAQSA